MKKSFTILELVFAIVLIGILAIEIIPRMKSNLLEQAALQLISDIRYTQHLAITDDKYNPHDKDWYKKRWQIIFGQSYDTKHKLAYSIFSDNATDDDDAKPGLTELAVDPTDPSKYLSGGYTGILKTSDVAANKKMNLGLSYDIEKYEFGGGCSSRTRRVSFDHYGRPIKDSLATYVSAYKKGKLLSRACTIKLINESEGYIVISIEPETGYAHITDLKLFR